MPHELKAYGPIDGAQFAHSVPSEGESHIHQSAYDYPNPSIAPYGPAFGNWIPEGGGIVELPMGGGPYDSGWIQGSPADLKGIPFGGGGFDRFPIPPGVTEVEFGSPYIGHSGSSSDRNEKIKDTIASAMPPIPGMRQVTRAAMNLFL